MLNFHSTPKPRKNKFYWERLSERFHKGEISEKEYDSLSAKHAIELEKRRKYKKGEPIHTFDEMFEVLNKDGLVWMFGRPMAYGFVGSQQFHCLKTLLESGNIFRVVKKEKEF